MRPYLFSDLQICIIQANLSLVSAQLLKQRELRTNTTGPKLMSFSNNSVTADFNASYTQIIGCLANQIDVINLIRATGWFTPGKIHLKMADFSKFLKVVTENPEMLFRFTLYVIDNLTLFLFFFLNSFNRNPRH